MWGFCMNYLQHLEKAKLIKILLIALFINLMMLTHLSAQQIDILLKGGHVIDAKNGIDGPMDIAITDGKISQVAPDIPESQARRVVNVSGMYVTPGLIDMHVHVFHGTDLDSYLANGLRALPPDGFTFRSGVTTVVDAGSAGWRNFPLFKKQTIDQARTRVLAFLNIVGVGMKSRFHEQNVSDMNPVMTAYCITKLYPDIIMKWIRCYYGVVFDNTCLVHFKTGNNP